MCYVSQLRRYLLQRNRHLPIYNTVYDIFEMTRVATGNPGTALMRLWRRKVTEFFFFQRFTSQVTQESGHLTKVSQGLEHS